MKVVHIIAPVEFGGGEALLINLFSIKCAGLDEEVFLINRSKTFERKLSDLGVSAITTEEISTEETEANGYKLAVGLHHFKKIKADLAAIKLMNPDVLHCHGYPANILSYMYRIFISREVKIVFTVHSLYLRHKFLQRIIYSRIFKSFDAITFVSNTCREYFIKLYKEHKNGRIIRNCIASRFFDAEFTSIKCVSQKIKIGQIGRLTHIKRHVDLIYAVSKLPSCIIDNLKVEFIGDGPDKSKLFKLICELKLENVFDFIGNVDAELMPSTIDKLDICVFPSSNEGFGLAAVECAARNKIIIAPESNIFKELLGNYPIYFKDGELCDALLKTIESVQNRDLRVGLTVNLDSFKPKIVKSKYEKLYHSL